MLALFEPNDEKNHRKHIERNEMKQNKHTRKMKSKGMTHLLLLLLEYECINRSQGAHRLTKRNFVIVVRNERYDRRLYPIFMHTLIHQLGKKFP